MTVLYLCSKHPAKDIRVFYKISMCLAQHGLHVINVHPNSDEGECEGIRIQGFSQQSGFFGRIISLINLYKVGMEIDADVILAPEPDSLVIAFLIGQIKHIRVIFDCHEWYNVHFTHISRVKNRCIGRFMNTLITKTLEYFTKRVYAVITVNDAMTGYYLKYNTNTQTIPSLMSMSYKTRKDVKRTGFYYFGQFGYGGQEQILLEAAQELKRAGSHAKIIILGGYKNESTEDNEYRRIIIEDKLSDNLSMLGWKDQDESFKILNGGLSGIMRFDSDYYKDMPALPNKIFEYMSLGLAVICSKKNGVQSAIVDEYQCGQVLDNETGLDLARAIMKLSMDEDYCKKLGSNALLAVKEKYNWDYYGEKLVDLLKR